MAAEMHVLEYVPRPEARAHGVTTISTIACDCVGDRACWLNTKPNPCPKIKISETKKGPQYLDFLVVATRNFLEPQNQAELHRKFNSRAADPSGCPFAVARRPNAPQPRVVDVGSRNPESRAAETRRGGPELRACRAKELAAIGLPSTVWGRTWREWIGQAVTLPANIE